LLLLLKNENQKLIEKVIPLVSFRSRAILETSIATVVAVIVPAILAHTPQNQFIVGPIINAILFWMALRVGIANALFIAVIPSMIALFRGMLPIQATTIIPFIILGNCVMILVFSLVGTRYGVFGEHGSMLSGHSRVFGTRYGAYLQIILAALAKTLVIALPAFFILNLPSTVSFMMSWPQLITAFVGGTIVIFINNRLSMKG